MNMTLRRLAPILLAASDEGAGAFQLEKAAAARAQRKKERGPSKLARRLRRKTELGRSGSF